MHYYKRNLGDYAKKAGRLSMLQHGAYTLLLDTCYDRERFPTEVEALEWTWASTPEEEQAVKFVLSRFFVKQDDGTYVQPRVNNELQVYKIGEVVNRLIALSREAKKQNRIEFAIACDQLRAEIKNEPLSKSHAAWTVLVEALIKQHETAPNHKPLTINHNNNSSPDSRPDAVDNSEIQKGKKLKFDPEDQDLARYIFSKIQRLNPAAKKPSFDKWANDIRLMREIDNRPLLEIKQVFDWANIDDFWQTNILSTDKLRKQYDTLLVKIKSKSNGNLAKPAWSQLPRIDEDLPNFAAKHKLPRPISGESFPEYRRRLNSCVDKKLQEGSDGND